MNTYDSSHLAALSQSLKNIYTNHPSAHVVLLSPEGNGKVPITDSWLDYYPTLEDVGDHLGKGFRIAIQPKSVDMVVVDIDVGGEKCFPDLEKAFNLSRIKNDPAKYCLHSSSPGKYHLWLPVKNADFFSFNRKKFTKHKGTDREYGGDLLSTGYVILHNPTSLLMARMSSGIRDRFFDDELKQFMRVDRIEPASKKKLPILTARSAAGLLRWRDGQKHDTCLQALKLITNPMHFKNDALVRDLLSQGEIDLIVDGKLTGAQVCEHALSLGSGLDEINSLLKTHYEEIDRHIDYGTKSDDADLRTKLINMDIVKRFEFMLRESNISLKYDVSRQFYEIDFNDGEGKQPYFDDKGDKNCKLLRCKLRQKYPAFSKSDPNGFSLAEVVWADIHAGFENLKHNQIDARQDYLKGDEWASKILSDFGDGVWAKEMDECVENAKKYFYENIEIEGDSAEENRAYLSAISAYFFKTYALCIMNELHRAKLIVVLVGHKDKGKSTFVKTLIPKDWQAPDRRFFTELSTSGSVSDWKKEMGIKTIGCVGVELNEVNLGSKTPLKELIGSDIISLRNMHEKKSTDRPRNFWMIGTSNDGQLGLSARDPDWSEKFGFLHVTEINSNSQEYADANLKKAIIGGWLLYNQSEGLIHPFRDTDDTDPAHKRWRDGLEREVGTSDESVLSDRLREMMLASCDNIDNVEIFRPSTISRTTPDISDRMKYDHLFDAYKMFIEFRSRRDWTGAGSVSHEMDELKAINNSRLFKTALAMVGWQNDRNKELGRHMKLVDRAGYWASKGFPGLSSESQP